MISIVLMVLMINKLILGLGPYCGYFYNLVNQKLLKGSFPSSNMPGDMCHGSTE